MVAVVRHKDIVVGSNRQMARRLELSVAAAAAPKSSHEPQIGVEHVDMVIGSVRHNHVTCLRSNDAVWPRWEFAFRRRFDVTFADNPAR